LMMPEHHWLFQDQFHKEIVMNLMNWNQNWKLS
jgi:hypothetical protein